LQLEALERREVPAAYGKGDVFLGLSNGTIEEHRPDGTLAQVLNTGTGGFITGMAFDSAGNLYATAFSAQTVVRFDPNGNLLGNFGSGYNGAPESIVFDAAGNVYVGTATGDHLIRKFSSTGAPLATFAAQPENVGTDWIDLAADQHTIFYTSEGSHVKRFDTASNIQLPDFATLPAVGVSDTGPRAFQLRILGDGGVLVADNNAILRLDSTGRTVQTYGQAATAAWFALNLDPDGVSFWSSDDATGQTVKFNIATGAVEAQFSPAGGSQEVSGLVVQGQITVAVPINSNISNVPSTRPPGVGPCNNAIQCYVSALYQQVLGGQPDPQGFNFWVNSLQTGLYTREQVANLFLTSPERLNLVVERFYRTILHRPSDPTGKQFWVQTLENGVSEANVVAGFVTSVEYTSTHQAPSAYVLGLYQDLLGRSPNASELAQQTQNLVTGIIDRGAMAIGVLAAPESLMDAVVSDTQCYLQRLPTQGEVQLLVAVLQTVPTTPSAFTARFFLGTDEYFNLVQHVSLASLPFCI
jgi:hypothetical protein